MKKIKILYFIATLFICISGYSQNGVDTVADVYKVLRIDTIRNAYLIQITRVVPHYSMNDFLIVLLEDSVNSDNLKQIMIGRKYRLKLRLYNDTSFVLGSPVYKIFIDNKRINISEKKLYLGDIALSNILDWELIEE